MSNRKKISHADSTILAVHLNFCPAADGGPAITQYIAPRTLLAWLPRLLMPDKERERLELGLDYLEKGSAYYAIQSPTVSLCTILVHCRPALTYFDSHVLPRTRCMTRR